jgi:hypothetical protein
VSKAGLSDAIFPLMLSFTVFAAIAAFAAISKLCAIILLNMPDIFLPPYLIYLRDHLACETTHTYVIAKPSASQEFFYSLLYFIYDA